jgi:hypothetical protein
VLGFGARPCQPVDMLSASSMIEKFGELRATPCQRPRLCRHLSLATVAPTFLSCFSRPPQGCFEPAPLPFLFLEGGGCGLGHALPSAEHGRGHFTALCCSCRVAGGGTILHRGVRMAGGLETDFDLHPVAVFHPKTLRLFLNMQLPKWGVRFTFCV